MQAAIILTVLLLTLICAWADEAEQIAAAQREGYDGDEECKD